MSYDGEVDEKDWCPNHACYKWLCPKPPALTPTFELTPPEEKSDG